MIKEEKKKNHSTFRQEISTFNILIRSKENPIISISFMKTKKTYNTCSCFKKSNIKELN